MFDQSTFGFSICPAIISDENQLTASTSWLACFLALGMSSRRLVVDRRSRTVTLTQRNAWFLHRKQTFPFSEIAAVTYGYEDANPLASFSTTHDAIDRYVVGLRVVGADEIRLFSFVGDGMFTNDGPLPDWWYWKEYALDQSGSQQRESRLFVQLLSKVIGVTIIPSTLTPE